MKAEEGPAFGAETPLERANVVEKVQRDGHDLSENSEPRVVDDL
jgi:hypothetical protein